MSRPCEEGLATHAHTLFGGVRNPPALGTRVLPPPPPGTLTGYSLPGYRRLVLSVCLTVSVGFLVSIFSCEKSSFRGSPAASKRRNQGVPSFYPHPTEPSSSPPRRPHRLMSVLQLLLTFVASASAFAPTGPVLRAAPKLARPAVAMSVPLVEVRSCARAHMYPSRAHVFEPHSCAPTSPRAHRYLPRCTATLTRRPP